MAVPAELLEQLLRLDEHERVEIAYALLASVEDKDELSEADRGRLHAAIVRSLDESDAGKIVPFSEAIASLRASRIARPAR